MKNKSPFCTLTDHELIEKTTELIQGLIDSGGKSWVLNIPARPDSDPDLIFTELNFRFKNLLERHQHPDTAIWVKGIKGFPIKKAVVAKFKHYDDPLRDWVVGRASSSTGEMITFDWHVSSITLDINHERWNMLEWLDEGESPSKEGNKEKEGEFAEWLYKNRWFSFENGKWHYTFEMGTAMSDKTYQKNYVKTTAQLYEQFKNRNNEEVL